MNMIRWTLFAAILCLFAASYDASAQGFNMGFTYFPPDAPLTTVCQGATPIADGVVIKIFQDTDNDGPDLTDPQPTVCTDPPECSVPFGAVNFNQFFMNGVSLGAGAGYFVTEVLLTCSHTVPANPNYYLRIFEPDGVTPLWTSTVHTAVIGYQEVTFTAADWTCGAGGPQCTVIDETE